MATEESKTLTMQELNTTELVRKNKVLELYSAYWNDDIPLKPHFNFADVQNILEDGAEIVSRIRYHVDNVINKDSMFTIRTSDGTANRFLFYTEINPVEEPEKFLHELVVASLSSMSHSNNQLESGVSMELIDAFISAFREYKNKLAEGEKQRQKYESYSKEHLLSLLHETSQLADQIFSEQNEDRDHHEEKIFLKAMVKSMENYYLYLQRYNRNSKFNHSIDSPSHVDVLDLISDFVIIERQEKEKASAKSETESENKTEEEEEEIQYVDQSSNVEEEKSEKVEEKAETKEETEQQTGQDPVETQKENIKLRASGFIKIANIERDIENTVSELDHLQEAINTLQVDYSKPRESLHSVEELLRKCLYWGEALMKDLLTLDEISSDQPSAETREIRKKQAVQIQKLMDDLEALKAPLKIHQTALFKPVHQLEEEERKINEQKQKEVEEKLKKERAEKEKIEKEEQQKQDEERRARLQSRKRPQAVPSAFPFLPSEIQKFFNVQEDDTEEEKGEDEAERDPLQNFADLLKPMVKQQQQHKRPKKSVRGERPPVPLEPIPRTPIEKILKEEKGDLEEEMIEDDIIEDEDEDVDLYYSLLRQWKLLKFEPNFETERQRGRFLIASNIPGMREDDFHIQINERDSTVTISGCRLPSRSEFEHMKGLITRRYRFHSASELVKTLFRSGIHRYGTFSSTLTLPRNVVYTKIDAKYEDGVLYVIAPFSKTKQIPVARGVFDEFSSPFYQNRGSRNTHAPSDFYAPDNFFF